MSKPTAHIGARIPRDLWRNFTALLKLKEIKQKDFLREAVEKFVNDHNGELP